jgi:hypothetical protein
MEQFRIVGMSRLDGLDLQAEFPDSDIEFEDASLTDPDHGELVTLAVIAVTVAGIHALAAWMLKNRKQARIDRSVEIVAPDGSRRTETLHIAVTESTTTADVAKALAALTDFDTKLLGQAGT